MRSLMGFAAVALVSLAPATTAQAQYNHDTLISKHAAANGVPESLVRRVIRIESTGNPRLIHKGNYGLMQIRLGTAKALGYAGGADGLLDADTNMTYAVRYLAGAYRLAGGNENRAVAYYQRGYYQEAKARGVSPYAAAPMFASVSEPVVSELATEPQAAVRRSERRRARQTTNTPFNLLAFLAEQGMSPDDKRRLRKRHVHSRRPAAAR